jgi:predicted ATP-dependent protease
MIIEILMTTPSEREEYSCFGKETVNLERTINGKKVNVPWDWTSFRSTADFPVDDNLISWVIGQERALQECFLCLDEWAHKLKMLEQEKWYQEWENPLSEKPSVKTKMSPGPYLLLLGDPGTGKSLLGRALAEKLTEVYQENKIRLFDVLCWKNRVVPSEPKISIQEAGKHECS